MSHSSIEINSIPAGPLGIIPLKGCMPMAQRISDYLSAWRTERVSEHKNTLAFAGYERDSYIIDTELSRFGSGEAKAVIRDSIRGMDIFLIVDVCNYSIEYKMFGTNTRMSPDDHFQDLKRAIAAMFGKANRISVIMPFLYEGRQHKRSTRESLDCAVALEELYNMGVSNIITFDAHDPRVINAAPLNGFENIRPSYQFLKALCKCEDDIKFDKDHLLMISPDEGAMDRAVYLASVLGIDMGLFYKRRDYSRIVDGMNPIIAHEYLGTDPSGKDVIIIDDMISSGGSMLDTADELKARGARNVYIFSTFGLFTNGLGKFDEAYEKGLFKRIITTNGTYQPPELLAREYYASADISKYIAYIIDSLNHNASISGLLEPSARIDKLIRKYNKKHWD